MTIDKTSSSTPPPSENEDEASSVMEPVEFETSSVYNPLLVVLWSVAPVACLVTGVVLSGLEGGGDDAHLAETSFGNGEDSMMNIVVEEEEGSAALCWAVGGVTLLLILYGLFLPRALVVIQNNNDGSPPTVAIQATCWMWRFPHVTHAYESTVWKHPAVFRNFATSCHRCVVVHQNNTRWLLQVSPTDAKGFVQAVEKANLSSRV